jgi:putative FmdB family regulatory protein
MPTYDYKCKACGHTLEIFQSMKDAPKRKCPNCGKNALERLIGTGAAVIFKGSGFYQTDYRSDAYKKSADADKPAATAETKTDAKAATTDSKTAPATEKPKTEPKPVTKSDSGKSDSGGKEKKPKAKA